MARSLDEIFPDLVAARTALEAAASPSERDRANAELNRLRAEAREAASDPLTHLSDRELRRQIRRADARLRKIEGTRFSVSDIGGGSARTGGRAARVVMEHDRDVDREMSRAEAEGELRALLAEQRRRQR